MKTRPLDEITAGLIGADRIIAARFAICRAIRGPGEIGPRYRVGSNAPVFDVLSEESGACPECGAAEDQLRGVDGREYCLVCGFEWVWGDYDWYQLADCLRYRQDLAAGMVQSG